MGIVNVTPDSFFDDSRQLKPEQAVDHALEMIETGADKSSAAAITPRNPDASTSSPSL